MAREDFRRQWVLASKVISRGYLVLGRDPVVIGRARDCTLPIFHDSISRKHARVLREGARFTLEDLGSTNGTFVQGRKIHGTHFLEHDQVLAVGSVEIRFLALDASREELAERFDPRAAETSVVEPKASSHAGALLAGEFTREVLLQVCQLIEVNQHTGVLRIDAGRTHGDIRFRDGVIVGAKFAGFRGEKAARTLLRLTSGEFAFKSGLDRSGGASLGDDARADEPTKLSAIALSLDVLHEQDRKKSGRAQDEFLDRLPSELGPIEKMAGETVKITRKFPRNGPPSDRPPGSL